MRFVIIGLGSFGWNVAKTLYENGEDVVAIDMDKNKVNAAKAFATQAVRLDTRDKESLAALGLKEANVAIVSLGPDMEASILTVLYLKEVGPKRIVAKALSEDHARILDAVGADEVIYPEKDMAVRTAHRLSNPNVLESLPLLSGVIIQELAPPDKFIGRNLIELDLRNKYGIQVLAIKEIVPDRTVVVPPPDFVIKDSDTLILMGEEKQLKRIASL